MAEKPKTRIHGVEVEDYITGHNEDGSISVDFAGLNEAINNSATCATLNCDNGVAGDGICQSCFMSHILDNMEWDSERVGWLRTDLEGGGDAEG